MKFQTVTDRDLEDYLEAKDPGKFIRSVGHYETKVREVLAGKDPGGDRMPWPKTHNQFRFMPGEVTLWHGVNGHGKSAVTTQVIAHLAINGKRSCIASLEVAPERTIERMLKQVAGNANPSDDFVNEFFAKFWPLIYMYEKRGSLDPRFLFAAMRYMAEKKATHFVVDSLMKCVQGEDDYNGQKNFVSNLCDLAEETQMHIHLVHHTRKSADENKTPNKFDAKGSGAITDLVHNVVGVWRNKAKEEAQRTAQAGAQLDEETPDFLLCCDKQKTLGIEGKWALWGDLSSWHFREQHRTPWVRGYELRAA